MLHTASEIPGKELEALDQVRIHIEHNYAGQVSLEDLTRIACMSSN